MPQERPRSARLVALAALGLLLFGFPFTAVFDVHAEVAGVPVLWAYLFAAWGAVVAVAAWVVRR